MRPLSPASPYAMLENKQSRRNVLIVKDLAQPKLRPLNAVKWHFVQNPEFAKLELSFHFASRSTFTKYAERYGMLGHSFDLELELGKQSCRLHRPICTQCGSTYLIFEFLVNGLKLEFDKD